MEADDAVRHTRHAVRAAAARAAVAALRPHHGIAAEEVRRDLDVGDGAGHEQQSARRDPALAVTAVRPALYILTALVGSRCELGSLRGHAIPIPVRARGSHARR